MHPWAKYDNLHIAKIQKRNKESEEKKKSFFDLRKERAEKGLCPQCGEDAKGFFLCEAHRNYRNEYQKARRRAKK